MTLTHPSLAHASPLTRTHASLVPRWCVQVVMWWGCFGLSFMFIAWRLAAKGAREGTMQAFDVPGQPPQSTPADKPKPNPLVDVQSASAMAEEAESDAPAQPELSGKL